MNKSKTVAGAVMGASLLITLSSQAAKLQPDIKKPAIGKTPPASVGLKPLQKPIQLTPAMKMRAKAPRMHLSIHFEQLAQQFHDLAEKAQEYEVGIVQMPEIQKACAEKSYSVQDQMAAGCSGDETLNQCMEKLVHQCVQTYSTSGISWGGVSVGGVQVAPGGSTPTFSTEGFREAAEQTAERARTLSQKMQQYADQASRNAAEWK